MKCPECGGEMADGYVFIPPGGAVVFWSETEPMPRDFWFFRNEWIRILEYSWGKRDKKYWLHVGFRCPNCRTIVIKAPPIEIPKTTVSKTSEELYSELVDAYRFGYGGNKQTVEERLEALTNEGLSRDEAICKLALQEGLIEGYMENETISTTAEAEPTMTAETKELYETALRNYNLVHGGQGKPVLDQEIESLMKQGISREEAIRTLATKTHREEIETQKTQEKKKATPRKWRMVR